MDISVCSEGAADLRRLLRDGSRPHRIRWRAARALGEIGERESVSPLSEALQDESPVVRWEAATALGRLGGDVAIDALTRSLDDESYRVRKRAALALVGLVGVPETKPENLEILMKLLPSGLGSVMEALVQMGSATQGALVPSLEDDSFFARQDAARTLAWLVRRAIEDRPHQVDLLEWLRGHELGPEWISRLYSFRTAREGRDGGLVKRVEYTWFDSISETILGRDVLELSEHEPSFSVFSDGSRPLAPSLPSFDGLPFFCSAGLEKSRHIRLERKGRTLVAFCGKGLLAVKLGLRAGDEARLVSEARFQSALNCRKEALDLRSEIPSPVVLDGQYLIRVGDLPEVLRAEPNLGEDTPAICYSADKDYFTYLNDPSLSAEDVSRGLALSAHDLATLASRGLIHDSLIPLFHNREQIERRGDRGVYRWWSQIPGRLDRWRTSCEYPNLRLSGIADFEHFQFTPQINADELRHHVGDHLLSISLVLGSYFRNREEFDEVAMSKALRCVFETYHRAFTGTRPDLDGSIDWDDLGSRMREEMEGDRYMIGLIRGGGPDGGDLMVRSGPHLGSFSGFFPIPELIRAIHIASLFAVLDLETHSLAAIPTRAKL